MYEKFYGFKEEPFRLSPDSRLCFRHTSYRKAKAYMRYALHRGEGFVMVTGRPGTGKSTLINDLVSELAGSNVEFSKLTSTQLEADDLLRLVVLDLGLDGSVDNKAMLLHRLNTYLQRLHQEGRRPLLIIDEAQDLSPSALEELRLLTNLQQNNQPLLQIFLVGQEELRDLVMSKRLEQLHQRIVAACHLNPLDEATTQEYVLHRLQHVGWNSDPEFDQAIFPYIHKYSLGIPRLINLICSRLLLHGMVEELHRLEEADVRTAIESLAVEQLLPTTLAKEAKLIRA
jgi:putative secretion ATPase (PEP-CTERM system associated)